MFIQKQMAYSFKIVKLKSQYIEGIKKVFARLVIDFIISLN